MQAQELEGNGDDRTFFITTQTTTYREFGDRRGFPFLYLGGVPGSRFEGEFAHEAAAHHGLHLIVVERPGLGRSSRQPKATTADCARQIRGLMDSLHIQQFGVIGFSAGALYAYAVASEMPERVVGVIDMAGAAPVYLEQLQHHVPRLVRSPLFYPGLFSWLSLVTRRMNQDRVVSLLRTRLCKGRDRAWLEDDARARLFARDFVEGLRSPLGCAQDIGRVYRPWGFDLGSIAAPVELWHGDLDDRLKRELVEYKAQALPSCTCHFVPEAGHLDLLSRFDDMFDAAIGAWPALAQHRGERSRTTARS